MVSQWNMNGLSTLVNRIDFGSWMLYLCNAVEKQCITTAGRNDCLRKYEVPYRRWAIFMINYSVYMMTSYMKPDEGAKAYAKNQVNEIWTLEKFARHIAAHNGVYSRGTVKGVLSDMCECLVEQLLNGNKIQLGELGTFGISLSCEPADSLDKFSAKNIKAVNILFSPGEDFENLISRADFNLVASRLAQAATLKAEKNNEKTVDLEAAKKKPTTSGDDNSGKPSKPSGDTGTNPGNSGAGSSDTTVNTDSGAGSEEGSDGGMEN